MSSSPGCSRTHPSQEAHLGHGWQEELRGVRGQQSTANARAAKLSTPQAPRGWRGLPSRAEPQVPVSQNHSETTGQMNPLSEVPRDGGDTAISVPAALPRKA